MRRRKTTADRASLAEAVRGIDSLSADKLQRRWKSEAEVLLMTFDEDESTNDLISIAMFYGFVRGLERAMADMHVAPFGTEEEAEAIAGHWRAVMSEYLQELKQRRGTEDVDY